MQPRLNSIAFFPRLNSMRSSSLLPTFLGFIAVVFFAGSLAQPYVTDDPLIYAMIGKAIYTKGILPFQYAFDHKPLFTYYLYGLIAIAGPDNLPKYQIISVLGFAASAYLTLLISKKETWSLHFLVIIGLSVHYLRFSGNTELFFSPMAALVVWTVLRKNSMTAFFLAGALAGLAFNMNYLALFSFGPAALYSLYSQQATNAQKLALTANFGAGFLAVFALLLLPLALHDFHLVGDYFAFQYKFIHGYGAQEIGRPIWKYLLAALPAVALIASCLPCETSDRRTRNAFVIIAIFALIAGMLTRKNFTYYLYPLVVPTTVIWALSTYRHKKLAVLICIAALAVMTAPGVIYEFRQKNVEASYDFSKFRELKGIVGNEKVLSIRAHNSIPYFADVTPAQPLVWPNHAQLFYGPKEDDYFNGFLTKGAKFVLLRSDTCAAGHPILPKSCDALASRYTKVMVFNTGGEYQRADFYQIKSSTAGGGTRPGPG